jgi:hypothetical protein
MNRHSVGNAEGWLAAVLILVAVATCVVTIGLEILNLRGADAPPDRKVDSYTQVPTAGESRLKLTPRPSSRRETRQTAPSNGRNGGR